ncbi:uncharacterized protein LOC106392972 [Brassica napus]|uniref:uncharacterized protein LOC106392972 n=2 Tax=Brassica napus TaxID=3708 RepID=UPI0020790EB5|nr:uncharacterized protein LOC106392972 [Brassica napus]
MEEARVLAIGDTRVSSTADLDETMMDVGERGRPPGDPPDKLTSWVAKVVETAEGGMPVPEVLIADSFVSERVRVEFPNGEDGEPSITIENEVLEAMNGMWKQCMIVRVLGRNVPIVALNRKLRELWNPKGAMYVMDLPRQFFMVRFEKEEEYLAALTGGPWRAFGSYLMVRAWSPEFDPLRDDIVTTPVWIRLTNIPVNFYHRSILMGIAKGLGKPIRVDSTTLNFERARFARVCVEVNLAKPLKGTVLINGERYFVAYEGLSEICPRCGIYGHLIHGCPRTLAERAASPTTQTVATRKVETANLQAPQLQEDGFILAKGSRKGTPSSSQHTTGTARKSNGEMNRNNRGNPSRKEAATIVLSNKYGELDTGTKLDVVREDGTSGQENKENLNMNVQNSKGKGALQEKLIMTFGSKASLLPTSQTWTRERGPGNKKTVESARGRLKRVNSRPVRGLVFGPTKGEISLSESGKRLRVENSEAGRSGGGLRERVEDGRCMPARLQLRDEELENPMESIISETEHGRADIQTTSQEEERVVSLA